MFDLLFGWRKASKCKKLIKRVQCRLKLLKNKRGCIVKQLREDVADLLKHGLDQTAFKRVEQLIMDENMVQVYDLLYEFCEFILINLPYIRKHRDCPNDINEAVSTLIFSSARFGELPELLSIRKLFAERYSQRFATTALELLPGNLVNYQIRETLYMKKVPDDVKHRTLDEIARICIQAGPLLLEYKPELEENDVVVDLLSENQQIWKGNDFDQFGEKWYHGAESSSEASAKLPEEVIYLDDIEEFVSPVIKNGSFQDQRLFMFRSFGPKKNRSRSSRKRSRRKKSESRQNTNVTDMECAVYYNGAEDSETSPDVRRGSRYRRQNNRSYTKDMTEFGECCPKGDKLRAMTMPCHQGGKEGCFSDEIDRSNSLPLGRSCGRSHIHPKLPDYDELAAKFMELKRENLLKQSSLED